MRRQRFWAWLAAGLLATGSAATSFAVEPSLTVSQEVDRRLKEEVGSAATKRCDDEIFLRRAALDLVGTPPTAQQVTLFVLDPAPDKRERLVRELLASPNYGANWARYWRDTIMARRTDDRGLISQLPLENYLTESFNKNEGWHQIATQFITATGNVAEEGETALFMIHMGQAEEVAAEVSRLFLGIQISCAQCHDHPTDRWKRQQFHELAAFFPRVDVKPLLVDGKQRGFEVASRQVMGLRPFQPGRGRGRSEHFMPDLQNPTSQGKMMQPVFFATQQKLATGTEDMNRRQTLADWLTAEENPWFAKALVNRVWGELIGRGFYEPVDDIGPDRPCTAPETLDYLAQEFAAHDYDLKWLFRTIMATDAYQRVLETGDAAGSDALALVCPQRLRADQLFDALLQALGMAEPQGFGGAPQGPGRYFRGGPRATFAAVFGYDPSVSDDEVSGSIPQALTLMNSPFVNGQINARTGATALGRLLSQIRDDEEAVVEVYLRTLSREPTSRELRTSLDYIRQVGNRSEAFEDLQWSLLNSTEFLHRR